MIEQILQAERLIQVDRVADARGIYERVVELDPRNAIAIVGLAQCALADGDEAGAHALAAQALETDPSNDMARRMEARLSEVLIVQGKGVERPAAAAARGAREMRPAITDALIVAAPPAEPPAPPAKSPDAAPAEPHAPVRRRTFLDRLRGR